MIHKQKSSIIYKIQQVPMLENTYIINALETKEVIKKSNPKKDQ